MGALESLNTPMYLHMFVKVGSLSETVPAPSVGTIIGSLVSVDPQVVKEVVPFAEMLAKISMVAF